MTTNEKLRNELRKIIQNISDTAEYVSNDIGNAEMSIAHGFTIQTNENEKSITAIESLYSELYKDMVSKKEYEKTFEEVAKVYCELTNNKFSKADTDAIFILQDVQGRHEQELHDKDVNYLEIIERDYITKSEAYQKAHDWLMVNFFNTTVPCASGDTPELGTCYISLDDAENDLTKAFGINSKEGEK